MASKEKLQYRLIDTQLTAGISYCRAAETSDDPSRKAFNIEQAERACKSALEFTRRTRLTAAMQDTVERKIEYLRELLSANRRRRVSFKFELLRPQLKKRGAA